ncbi:MAG TPA: helix-turn-helix transcriptional regulator [Oleiagrimonas sp.]|nr:helix-turn-helix transcriptional regulator [Oleiagrimonas sp.]
MRRTTDEWQAEIGQRLRAARIRASLEQTALAAAANISVGAVKNLESGKGSTLTSLINVLRTLDLLGVLETLPPADMPSPLHAVRSQGHARLPRRVVKPRAED